MAMELKSLTTDEKIALLRGASYIAGEKFGKFGGPGSEFLSDFDKKTGLQEYKQDLDRILDLMEEMNVDTI